MGPRRRMAGQSGLVKRPAASSNAAAASARDGLVKEKKFRLRGKQRALSLWGAQGGRRALAGQLSAAELNAASPRVLVQYEHYRTEFENWIEKGQRGDDLIINLLDYVDVLIEKRLTAGEAEKTIASVFFVINRSFKTEPRLLRAFRGFRKLFPLMSR